jgi:hypothetical protein
MNSASQATAPLPSARHTTPTVGHSRFNKKTGTMAANGSGLQMSTLRNLAMAWVLTLPVAMILSASLYWIFRHVF